MPASIGPRVLHIWEFDLEDNLDHGAEDYALLDHGERDRASRLMPRSSRSRFISAHSQLRKVLSRYLGSAPEGVRFAYGRRGKPRPFTAAQAPGLTFSLSHCAARAVVALATGVEVGIDIEETTRPINVGKVAERYFSPEEVTFLDSLEGASRNNAFFDIWTKKEAIVKAMGEGVFSLNASSVDALLRRAAAHPKAAGLPTLLRVQLDSGWVGAVAALGQIDKVESFKFSAASLRG